MLRTRFNVNKEFVYVMLVFIKNLYEPYSILSSIFENATLFKKLTGIRVVYQILREFWPVFVSNQKYKPRDLAGVS